MPGPGRDHFAEEPSENKEMEKFQDGESSRHEKVAHIHFLVGQEASYKSMNIGALDAQGNDETGITPALCPADL